MGCPFVLSWQMNNNELMNGIENGHWLIDDHGVKQPLWHTLSDFYKETRRYVADYERQSGRIPGDAKDWRFALGLLS